MYQNNPAHTGMASRRTGVFNPSSYDVRKSVSVDALISRLSKKRPFLDMPERRLRTVITAIAETLEPGERIDLDAKSSEKKELSRWDDEGGAGGWS
jgi:hypothetical protein